jgi:PAS domain S-box-containing protein
MTEKDDRPEQAPELNVRAEQVARESTDSRRESLEAPLPDEEHRTFHELYMHQVELKMQNEELRRAQAELAAARERYFDLYDLAPVGYCTISEQGLILECNLTAATLLGMARSELVKQSVSRFIHKEDQDIYCLHCIQLFETGEPQEWELRMVQAEGTGFWAHLDAIAVQDSDGAPVCRLVISDVTEHKFREDERELTARLIALVNTPGDLRECMSALADSLKGWSGCDSVGIRLRVGDDYPYFETRGFPPEFVHEENLLCAYGPDGTILRDGEGSPVLECMCGTILCGRFDPSKPFFTAHGSFWSNNTSALLPGTDEAESRARMRYRCMYEGYQSLALIPLRTVEEVFGLLQFNDHRPNRFNPILISHFERMADILAIALSRRQAEEELRESERRLKEAQKLARLGHWIWDARTGNIDWSGEVFGIFGLDPKEFTPHMDSILALSPWPEDHERDRELYRKAMQSREEGTFEQRFLRPDKSIGYFHSTFKGNYDDRGNLISIVGTVQDITERKRAEEDQARTLEQLRQSQKMEAVGLLAGGIAHDFNNLLMAIVSYGGILQMEMTEDDPLRTNVDMMLAVVDRAAGLTQSLLAFSRQQVIHLRPCNLNDIIGKTEKFLARVIGEDIEIQTTFREDPLYVNADNGQLEQVLINLATNARDAMPHGGLLSIVTESVEIDSEYIKAHGYGELGEYALFSITDAGAGMDAATTKRIFEPFFTTKEPGKGTGLGLAVVYGIVKQHGGYINVYSEPGRGTTFRILLPLLKGGERADTETVPQTRSMGGTETILLAEDEAEIRKLIRAVLMTYGYTVVEAADGEDAVNEFIGNRERIQLLLLDLIMPKKSGKDACDEIRKMGSDVRTIFISGYPPDVIQGKGLLEEGCDLIMKPVSPQILLRKIREVLDR